MGRGNDGFSTQMEFSGRQAGQDRKHFPLGKCTAPPARGYWADRAGLSKDYQIEEAIVGLTDPQEIKAKLIDLGGYAFAHDYMTFYKMGWTY